MRSISEPDGASMGEGAVVTRRTRITDRAVSRLNESPSVERARGSASRSSQSSESSVSESSQSSD